MTPSNLDCTSLSFEQERMWLLDQLSPGQPAYNIRGAVEIRGVLNVSLLEQSLNELVNRHEILRTHFAIRSGEPRQVILPNLKVTLPVEDLQNRPAQEREAVARQLATQIVQQPFDLNQSPLWRVHLLELAATRYMLVLSMHHIICDGDRSLGIFFQELATLYEAFSCGKLFPLPELSLQYKEFALWQRQQLTDEFLKPQLAYWKKQLEDNLPVLPLPIDHPRPATQTYSGACQELTLSEELSQKLQLLSQQQGVYLFVTLLTAFKTLLYRYTGQPEIVVGSPTKGRNLAGTEGIIGYFGNPLVLRSDMSGNPSFREVLSRVSKVTSQAEAHQDYPFQKLVEVLKPERDLSYAPLFQVLFILRDDLMPALELRELTLTPLDVESLAVPYDLSLSIKDNGSEMVWLWEYNADLFEHSTINRMISHCQTLLESIVDNPETRIDELPLLIAAERDRLLFEWNNTQAKVSPQCVHQLFEAQVEQTPDAAAVVFAEEVLTYRQLNHRANQLAHYLQRLGVGPEKLVGICLERSVELAIAILAILKAGGAYVPLDPTYPVERLAYMLSDAKVQGLLTTRMLLDTLPQLAEAAQACPIIYLDEAGTIISQESNKNPASQVQLNNLVYCLYTSGSTCQPKGVAMEHLALSNLIEWHLENRLSVSGTKMLQFAPASFDISVHEMFASWCSGGTLVLVAEQIRRNPLALLEFIVEKGIEKLYLPFIALQQLAEAVEIGPVPTLLREVITAGEQLQITPAIANLFRLTGATLYNHYGATEIQDVTSYKLTGDVSQWSAIPPIGRPINNTQIYILDRFHQPVPIGVTGELYISGNGLARGYLNRPELTEEKFIPHPFLSVDSENKRAKRRLYRTGDLARYLPDGNIEHLGRVGYQVKVRGFRIELGEIETSLTQHPAIRESVVVARSEGGVNKSLVGYVVPAKQLESSADTSNLAAVLSNYLKEKLPDYMVPQTFVILNQMPLTSSGKINRQALPAAEKSRLELGTAFVKAKSKTEKLIAQVWQELLHLEEVGVNDNFFDIGGNSLLIIRAHKKLTEIFATNLPAVTLFQYPTIQTLAQHLSLNELDQTLVAPKVKNHRASARVRRHLDRIKIETTSTSSSAIRESDIAIIGMSCRFPGSENIEAFWQNLRDGVESISFFSDEEIELNNPTLLSQPNYVKAGAVLPNIEEFDASFFDYSIKEATITDPQQRLLLECAWEAMESAGYNCEIYQGLVGVYIGSGMSTYLINNVAPHQGVSSERPFLETDDFQVKMGNDRNYYATRISYKLNLTGPSVNVQTACSTSLVTVHMAIMSLLNGECDMALAGGVAIAVPQKVGYLYQDSMIRSPDGHCRAFDAQAKGTLFGNGGGLVVLKLLSKAISDGDNIVAVIKGSAINNDGSGKVGYTAPSVEGQAKAIADALAVADIDASTITYVETHGTATALGDPIEIAALTQAFRQSSEQAISRQHCAIGSVKTNIGHLDEAAGIASLIKTALALSHKTIPPSLNFSQPNPQINFDDSPFYVNTKLSEWKTNGAPRRAGVSSFGMGGTNCHMVLEEALEHVAKRKQVFAPPLHLLALSAKNEAALRELAQHYAVYLQSHPDASLGDICFTANTGRKHFNHRLAIVTESTQQLRGQLETFLQQDFVNSQQPASREVKSPASTIAFLYTGQGTQYVGMGQRLYDHPIFRETLDYCDEILRVGGYLDRSLLDILYPKAGQDSPLDETAYTQPALFAIEYALTQLWKSWGIEPDVVVGHSVGEYVAACVAGVFSLEDGLKLIAARGRLMQALPQNGEMVSIRANEAYVTTLIKSYGHDVSIAAINGPESIVISGQREAINGICATLQADGVKTKKLKVSHAFHSSLMEPMLAEFEQVAQLVSYSQPQIDLISNVTGQIANNDEIATPDYWVRHVRQSVKFAECMETLNRQGVDVLLEIGPLPVLLGMGRQCLPEHQGLWLPTLRSHSESGSHQNQVCVEQSERDWQQILTSLTELYLHGVSVDWFGFYMGKHASTQSYPYRRLPLPTYPFQRQRYWIEGKMSKRSRPVWESWLYEVAWHSQERILTQPPQSTRNWLILTDEHQSSLGWQLADILNSQGENYTLVFPGKNYERIDSQLFRVNAANPKDFQQLLSSVPDVDGVIYCWNLIAQESNLSVAALNVCGGALHLVQALINLKEPLRLWLVTQGSQAVNQQMALSLWGASLWGMGGAIALEHPELNCVRVDLDPKATVTAQAQTLFKEIYAASPTDKSEDQIAFRNQIAYVPRLVRRDREVKSSVPLTLRNDSSYLITGGLGGLGLLVTRFLVEHGARHLVLVGRREVKPSVRYQLQQLEQAGVRVSVAQADVADSEQVASLLAQINASSAPLRGIIHAAGVLDDGILQKQTWERFFAVMAPKASGAWNLHTQTAALKQPLDFFVLFSSSTSLFGTAGQANYAAANAFLDGLASYRRMQGLPGLSINWGAWSEVGMTARLQMNEWLSQKGEGSIAPQQGLQVLEQLLKQSNSSVAQVGVLPINWSQFLSAQFARAPFFNNFTERQAIVPLNGNSQRKQHNHFRTQLENTSDQERLELLKEHINIHVAQILGGNLSVYSEEDDIGFYTIGMDSLTSIELRNNLQTSLDCSLPATLIFDYPTVKTLANYLEKKMFSHSAQHHHFSVTTQFLKLPFNSSLSPDKNEIEMRSSVTYPVEPLPLIKPENEDKTIDEIAKQLAKQLGLNE